MPKKPSTVNLEESVWNDIELFMRENNVNRNTAIEWMLIERRILLSQTNDIIPQTNYQNKTKEVYPKETLTKSSVITTDKIKDIFDEMPD